MSLKVIELNDRAIKVGDSSGIIVESPGFALAVGNGLELGEAAEQQARLQPTNSYNKYWHELSMEPLAHGNNIRHYADIAYAQLLHLAELGEIDADVIFAVPGNFTRQQLAILLGLVKQSPFNAVGVVDSALTAAIATAAQSDSVIFADIQLHQVLLTKLAITDNHLKTESVIQVPGVGSQNFMDLMMQLATGMFVQQCRFNPQHNAESEQLLYNNLPLWLQQNDRDKSSLQLELKTSNAVHTAKMPRESLVKNLSSYYQKINQQIAELVSEQDSQLLVSAGLASLPGFTATLAGYNDLRILEPDAINAACLGYQADISSNPDAIKLINELPVAGVQSKPRVEPETSTPTVEVENDAPTHALFSNRAVAIDNIEIRSNVPLNGHAAATHSIQLSISDLPEHLGRIERHGDEVFLDSGKQNFFLNQTRVSGKQKLVLGDRISFANNTEEICLIRVNDG